MLINVLAQSYWETGWGVAVHPAGGMLMSKAKPSKKLTLSSENCKSADFANAMHQEVKQVWDMAINFRFNRTPFEANMDRESEKLEVSQRLQAAQIKKHEEKVAAVRKRIEDKLPDIQELRDLLVTAKFTAADTEVPEFVRSSSKIVCENVQVALERWEPVLAKIRRDLDETDPSRKEILSGC